MRLQLVVIVAVAAAAGFVGSSSCAPPAQMHVGPVWKPGVVYPPETQTVRGFRDVRGLVHAHSVYSHDACDGKPVLDDGTRDPVCFEDFRRGLCQSQHDFVFVTDHKDAFDDVEFPAALLYRADEGDVLLGDGRANRITCDDGHTALVMAGNEGGMMPVGIESHLVDGHDARDAVYGAQTADAAQQLHDHGAVVLLAHPEDFDVDTLASLPVEGFEMYNLHANTLLGAGQVLDVLVRWGEGDTTIVAPDLLVMELWSEDPRYIQRWGNVLARGKHVVTTMGTDCHRNTFPSIMEDGERADSYRRMMIAFSNHLRVTPADDGTVDDRVLKEALHAGRNWGAFEMMGYPVGFDSFAVDAHGDVVEMGDTAPVGSKIVVVRPAVKDLDPSREAPTITLRILRATDDDAGFEVVASSTTADKLEVTMDEAGAYRAEVRMMPLHLRQDMRADADVLLDQKIANGQDYVWIYAGAIYAQ